MNDGKYTYAMSQMSVAAIWNMTGELARERTMLAVGGSEHRQQQNDDKIVDKSTTVNDEISVIDSPTISASTIVNSQMVLRSSDSVYLLNSSANLDLESSMRFLLDLYSHWFREGADAVPLPLLSVSVESVSYCLEM